MSFLYLANREFISKEVSHSYFWFPHSGSYVAIGSLRTGLVSVK